MLLRWLVIVAAAVVPCSSLSSRAGSGAGARGKAQQPERRANTKTSTKPAAKPNWKPAQLDATAHPGAEPRELHACDDLIVVDKPVGWLTHDDGAEGRPSVASWVAEKYGGKPGVHQRLDIDCSGVLCFARSAAGNALLSDAFEGRTAKKVYFALVDEMREGCFDGRESGRFELPVDGSAALTEYEVVQRDSRGTLVRCKPHTGRRHQIRFHLASFGAPIRGDARYGCGIDRGASRTLLHCSSIELGGLKFEAPLPCDMELDAIKRRAQLRADPLTTAFREVHGAADGASVNFAIDRYADHLLVQRPFNVTIEERDDWLDRIDTDGSVYEIVTQTDRSHGGQALPTLIRGPGAPEGGFVVLEHGVSYHVELTETKLSTGLWLDARPQRLWFTKKPLNVLNVFAHAGGYSVAAATAGSPRTVSVDISPHWLGFMDQSLSHNGITNDVEQTFKKHDAIYGDAFEWLRRLGNRDEKFDVVVLDPPSTSINKKKKRWAAAKDYGDLVKLAAPLVKPGGAMWTTTNSRKLRPRQFAHIVRDALRDISDEQEEPKLERSQPPPPDFPVKTMTSPEVKNLLWRFPGAS